MALIAKKCPNCGDSNIDDNLVCRSCGSQLEYSDEKETTLIIAQDLNKCKRCGTKNPPENDFCEKCGRQLFLKCPVCGGRHSAKAYRCGKTGEVINKSEPEPVIVAKIPEKTPEKIPPPIPEAIPAEPKLNQTTVNNSLKISLYIGGIILLLFLISMLKPQNQSSQHSYLPPVKPRIDVVFVIDSTGSMNDEIEVVKDKLKEMVRQISEGQPTPEVRYGLVTYRDRGDEYVVKKFPFTRNIDEIQNNINSLVAKGGGDIPESVNEAMHVAIQEMEWDTKPEVGKMVFLIGDAGPHMDYTGDYDYRNEIKVANSKGIQIFTIGCSGIDQSGNGISVFQEIARETGGTFDYLTYQQTYVDQQGRQKAVIYYGDKTYEYKKPKDMRWRGGAPSVITDKKYTAPVAPSVVKEEYTKARSKDKLQNNLDHVLTEQIKQKAVKQGVIYKK